MSLSQHDDRLPLLQMRDHAREAVEMLSGHTPDELRTNRMMQLALVRLVEVVGEAARRVSAEGQARHPDVPWREAITIRNRLIHNYDTINYTVIWDTILEDFPPLVAALDRALATEPG